MPSYPKLHTKFSAPSQQLISKTNGTKVLHLTLKKRWFDMIASGEKKEEYREIKPYWVSRLVDELWECEEGRDFSFEYAGFWWTMLTPQAYDVVKFTNGYGKHRPSITLEITDITDGYRYDKEDWGAEDGKPYFIIKLGKIIEPCQTK